MSGSSRRYSAPPRLLLGAALLYWGAMVGHPLVGLLLALLVEGRTWVGVRWNFGEVAFTRAWAGSLSFLGLAFAWMWMDGAGVLSMFQLLRWWPVFFLPLILVQQYAMSRSMLLNTFSVFARRKMQQDRKDGREVRPIRIHFGYVYLALVVMASALGDGGRGAFYVGLSIFAGLTFFFVGKTARQRPLAWFLAMGLACLLGFGGAVMVNFAYRYIESGRFLSESSRTFPGESMTAIGRIGMLKLSHRIHWRVKVEGASAPLLYREAIFSKYGQGLWRHVPGSGTTQEEDFNNQMASRGDKGDVDLRFVFDRLDFDIDQSGARKLELTGSLDTRGPTPIPLPSGTRMLRGLQADGVDYNSLGTVVVVNPDYAATRFEVYQQGRSGNEEVPYSGTDLQIPADEEDAVHAVVEKLGLRGMREEEMLSQVKRYFASEFSYSLYQQSFRHIGPSARRSMAIFLEETKRGHCEYFATAATLILREAGVPTRYAVGYAAKEQGDGGEWLLRGQHGHAWCRVYLGGVPGDAIEGGGGDLVVPWEGGRWVDFDPTPGTWLATEGSGLPWEQNIIDWWQTTRQDLLIWRSRAENRQRVSWTMGIVGAIVVGYVFIRLWQSRLRRVEKEKKLLGRGGSMPQSSPLTALIKSAEAILGPRPEGRPLTNWLLDLATLRPPLASSLERAVHFHWRARFDPLGLEEDEGREFRELCRALKKGLRR